jgi:tripartite-type tricarboxylate transporter receptor subunit TctC
MKTKLVPAAAWALALLALPGYGQDAWPARPVKLIVPSSAGGGTDLYARTPEQFSADMKKERDSWAAFIRRNGIVQEE